MTEFETVSEELQKHLDCAVQNWFLGAGVSLASNIPLMYGLTDRVEALISNPSEQETSEIYAVLKADLPESSHVEHVLSHLGDLIAIADRSHSKSCRLGERVCSLEKLSGLYKKIIEFVGETIRYGYKAEDVPNGTDEVIGTVEHPIVDVEHHRRFVRALFGGRANLESRSRISFFTSNYDTLLEDAMSLERKLVVDGFSGGAMGFWNPEMEYLEMGRNRQCSPIYKLHGSIDWNNDPHFGLLRCRYGVQYLADPGQVLIYPQATKYMETQKDPFAYMFAQLRNSLASTEDNSFITCGYSFGDEHINSEIEEKMKARFSRTTLIAFAREDAGGLPKTLLKWLANSDVSSRVFVASDKGLYNGSEVLLPAGVPNDLAWWSFSGLTDFLVNGVPS